LSCFIPLQSLLKQQTMEYEFVKINGTKHPIKFGFNALRKYSAKTNTALSDLDKLGNDMTLEQVLTLVLCGIEDGYRAAKQECKLTLDSLADSIDGDYEAITKCMEILATQMSGNTTKKQKAKKG